MEDLYSRRPKAVISIISSKSNAGKTTLIEGLIKVFKSKNYSVGALKHDAHEFSIDKEGKDSYRFAAAGADNVIISSSQKLAMVMKVKRQDIDKIVEYLHDCDIILIEGFKDSSYPKIEVYRKAAGGRLLFNDKDFDSSTFIAVASDEKLDIEIPMLDLNDIECIAHFIEDRIAAGLETTEEGSIRK